MDRIALPLTIAVGLLASACFDPEQNPFGETTFGPPPDDVTSAVGSDSAESTTDSGASDTTAAGSGGSTTSPGTTDDGADVSSSGPPPPVCGNGELEEGEECDDGNADDTDECPSSCLNAFCGDGFVLDGTEACDDGNEEDGDACLTTCEAASCGDGIVHVGVEQCDDGNMEDGDACPTTCEMASCGDGFVFMGMEQCDDGNMAPGDGCGPTCLTECANPGGGPLTAENGTGMGVDYCYAAGDSVQVRAQKACESHFGLGNCCVITGGYQDQQYGQCGQSGGAGTIHWHWDNHPAGHCAPMYVVGEVVSPGWCGVVLGSFTD